MAVWSLERKCSETVVGLEMLVCLSTVLRCSLRRSFESSFSFSYVLLVTTVLNVIYITVCFSTSVEISLTNVCSFSELESSNES